MRNQDVLDFVRQRWGGICPDYEPNCGCCKAWKAAVYIIGKDVSALDSKSAADRKACWEAIKRTFGGVKA